MKDLQKPGRWVFILLFLCTLVQAASAQNKFTIKGEIVDSLTNKGAEYATIVILNSEGKPAASMISDANGKFSAKVNAAGDYVLTVSSIGYTPINRPFKVTGTETDLGSISFVPGVELEGVTVAVTRPLIRSDVDKIAYSVEDDPETPTSTALDILRKVPLVTVDGEDNIYLQGQSNYKVLMNGKSSSLLSSNFKEMMRSMPASSIKDIEVITNPSSKYEAEGVGGIINIITNRRNDVGYNGSIGFNGSTMGQYGGYGYINAKLGKFTLSANAFAGHFEQPDNTSRQEQQFRVPMSDGVARKLEEGSSDGSGRYMNYQVEASYEIDTFNLVTLSFWAYDQKYKSNGNSAGEGWDEQNSPVYSYLSNTLATGKYSGLSGNIDYQRTFMKPDRTFTLSYKLDHSPQSSETERNLVGMGYPSEFLRSVNDAFSREHTFQVDYADPITTKHFIEVGAKYILRQNDSDPETYRRNSEDAPWLEDPARKNNLDYDQHILGIYGGYTFKLKKLSFKAGARMESAWSDGEFIYMDGTEKREKIDNNQFDVIPYATISYAPKPTNRYSLSYTQRLSRPGIWYLNPYLNDMDPNYWSKGNPNLDSEISHQINATYGIYTQAHTLNLTASVALVDNSIQEVSESIQTEDGRTVLLSTYENIGKNQRYQVNAYYSYRKGTAFSFSMNNGINYVDYSGKAGLRNYGWQYNGNANLRIGLWKEAAFNAFGGYGTPRVSLQGENSGRFYYGLGMNQRFFEKKLSLNVSVQHPFDKYYTYWSELDTKNFYRRSENRMKRRMVHFSVSYNFGKMNVQVKKARRTIQNDDLKSGEGNSGGGGTSGGGSGGGQ